MNQRERELLVEIGRYWRNRIKQDFGSIDFAPLRHAIREGVSEGARCADIIAGREELDSISFACALEPPGPSSVGGLMATLRRLVVEKEDLQGERKRDAARAFHVVSVTDVVNQSDLLVTVRMPRASWDDLHRLAGVAPTKAEPKSLLSSALDFGKRNK